MGSLKSIPVQTLSHTHSHTSDTLEMQSAYNTNTEEAEVPGGRTCTHPGQSIPKGTNL